jgi:sigma-B regulation protein RsbU (phosphoserine phosphatase)
MSTEGALEAFYAALLEDDPERLYEQAPCGYLSTLPDGTIIKVNGTFLTLTGYDRSELVGQRTFSELLTVGGRIYHETHYAPMLQMHGSAREIALEIRRADGSRLAILVNSVLERDGAGDPAIIRTAVFDATHRREYERELLRAKDEAEASERRASELARVLQQTFIPPPPPDVPGLELAAVYRPAGDGTEVGGDFYDVFELGPGELVIALGDVSGKGVRAAVVTALARHTIRAAAVRHARPSEILATLNELLLRDDADHFCTVALLRMSRTAETWAAEICIGGHPQPLLLRSGAAPTSLGSFGSLLGLLPDPVLHDEQIHLRPGDTILLYTDGVTEGRGDGDFYGEGRLHALVGGHLEPAATLADSLVDDVLAFQGHEPRDDIAVVTVHLSQ